MSQTKHAPKRKRSKKTLTVLSVAGASLVATASGAVAEMLLSSFPEGQLSINSSISVDAARRDAPFQIAAYGVVSGCASHVTSSW